MINPNDALPTLKDRLEKAKSYLVLIIIQTLLMVLGFCVYHKYYADKTTIGVVNITGIADDFIKRQNLNQLPNEELKKAFREFGNIFEKEMKDLSARRKIILIPAEAVITGARDYTEEVRGRLPQPKLAPPTIMSVVESKVEQTAETAQKDLAQKLNQLDEYLAKAPRTPSTSNPNESTQAVGAPQTSPIKLPNANEVLAPVQASENHEQTKNQNITPATSVAAR